MAIINPEADGEDDPHSVCRLKLHKNKTVVYIGVAAFLLFVVLVCYDIFF